MKSRRMTNVAVLCVCVYVLEYYVKVVNEFGFGSCVCLGSVVYMRIFVSEVPYQKETKRYTQKINGLFHWSLYEEKIVCANLHVQRNTDHFNKNNALLLLLYIHYDDPL